MSCPLPWGEGLGEGLQGYVEDVTIEGRGKDGMRSVGFGMRLVVHLHQPVDAHMGVFLGGGE